MQIGIPKEIKLNEKRVGLVPSLVSELTGGGHVVIVETGAGEGIGASDQAYEEAGAEIESVAAKVFARAEMIVKVKEPQPAECEMLSRGQILFTYLHLAADPVQTEGLRTSECVGIAYETITDDDGTLPLLAPMSEIAGRMSVQVGARCLEDVMGGSGVLLGGVPGIEPAKVVIIGAGIAGSNAVAMATGLGADVTVIDINLKRLKKLDQLYAGRIRTLYSTRETIERHVSSADLVIGTVLIPGAAAPKLISANLVRQMKPGAALVDVAVDQGGCSETTRPTTHAEPTYVLDGVVHYCVANMPGAVARSSTFALTNATFPYVRKLADLGWRRALKEDPHLLNGLNVCNGDVTYEAVANDLALDFKPASEFLDVA